MCDIRRRTNGCRLWVRSGHSIMSDACPLYPRKQSLVERFGMSALCHKRTSRSSRRLLTVLRRFKIWLEGLYRDLNCRICVGPPQFVTGEHYGVQPLRIVALIDCYRVRIHVTALAPLHHAQLSSRIARQACVGLRIDVSGAYAIPRFEVCRCLLLAEV